MEGRFIADAERQTGIKAQNIGQVVKGLRSGAFSLQFKALGWNNAIR